MADYIVDPDGTGDYTSLNACIAAQTAQTILNITCISSGGTADTTAVVFPQYTNDCTITITAGTGHKALKTGWSTTRYRLEVTDARCMYRANYGSKAMNITVDGLQIQRIYSSVQYQYIIEFAAAPTYTNNIRFKNCRIRANSNYINGFRVSDVDYNLKMYNCILNGTMNTGFSLAGSGGSHYVYNTIIKTGGGGRGVDLGTGCSLTLVNSAVFDNIDDIYSVGTLTMSNCATDDGDGTNPVAPYSSNWANEFVDYANGDFTLKGVTNCNCYHGGLGAPDASLYTTDIEGDSYNSSAYSIGIDEIIGASSGVVVIRRRRAE